MKVELVTSVAVIAPDPAASRALYVNALSLPLAQLDGDYHASEGIEGCRHFGVWPLAQAAEACFGATSWPDDVPVPQTSIEFEVADPGAVAEGLAELRSRGFRVLHGPKTEPWGQTVARVLAPEGVLVGISHVPSLHEEESGD